jgi:shikimate dehydrogenase
MPVVRVITGFVHLGYRASAMSTLHTPLTFRSGLTIANRTPERAQALAAAFRALAGAADGTAPTTRLSGCGYDALAAPTGDGPFDLVLHATSLGLKGATPPVPPGVLGPRSAAYDLGYGVPDTPFVRWARAHGAARAEQGFGMLIEQAAESFRVWRGVRPDTALLHQTPLHQEGVET